MKVLIVKLGATGDVVRTTPLLRVFDGQVTWLTSPKNKTLLEGLPESASDLRVVNWHNRSILYGESFDLVINLEDDLETADILRSVHAERLFGAYADKQNQMRYTEDASKWFDLSLISTYGRAKADELKLHNRRSYQEMIFDGLGLRFKGEQYLLPQTFECKLQGDVAIAPEAGPVWPMKHWAHYDWLKAQLENRNLKVNFLPTQIGRAHV